MEAKPLVVIVGPTASGKTSLAISLAEKHNGEIICADSRTVYKGMDIGTAKPTVAEQARVPHWGLDLVDPSEEFNVTNFKQYTLQKITEIRARGRTPFLVGGTGLYVDSIIFDYQFGDKRSREYRYKLESMSLEALHIYCAEHNIIVPENYKNKRYVIRAIELNNNIPQRQKLPIYNCIIVGITTERDILRSRIEKRVEQIFDDGVVDEAIKLGNKYGWNHESMTGNIYPLCKKYIDVELTLDEMKSKFVTLDWRLAKRQLTWLRRNKYIEWHDLQGAFTFIDAALASRH